jgi:hypothetical protein
MFLVDQQPSRQGRGAETVGWGIADEADMIYGPGNAAWSGVQQSKSCVPVSAACGYTVMQTLASAFPQDGRPFYANYGKGILFWQTDPQATQFVNSHTQFLSADVYWYSDNDACVPSQGGHLLRGGWDHTLSPTECHRASNYGATIDRLSKLDATDGKLQPIFSFIEVGHPGGGTSATKIDGPELQGAVMSSLIHGAAGIIYFNHNFGGPCISGHVLRDKCGAEIRPGVMKINSVIKDLAPVLNTQSFVWIANAKLDTMLKRDGEGHYYLFAQQNADSSDSYTLALPETSAKSAEVLYENRSVSVVNGKIKDSFAAEYSWHIYKFAAN